MSINLDVAPTLFGALISCGLPEVQMTSVAAVRPSSSPTPMPTMPELARRWAEDFAVRAGYRLDWGS
jgi:lipoic acid synthetase/lipoyl(octanoyl) transferase